MARDGSGVYSKPAGTTAVANTTIESAKFNLVIDDFVTDANTPRPIVAGGTGASTASGARTNLGLAIGTDVQAYDAGLASISGLTTAADKMIYTTAADTYAVADLTAAGRALLDDADASAQRTTLGLGNIATTNLIDEDDMASDTDAQAPTQQSVKAYVDANGITQTTGSAPYYGARAWGKLSGSTLNAGGNVASVSNPATGQYAVTFTIAMPDANYAVIALGHDLSGFTGSGDQNDVAWAVTAQSTTGFTLSFETAGDAPQNFDSVSFVVFR